MATSEGSGTDAGKGDLGSELPLDDASSSSSSLLNKAYLYHHNGKPSSSTLSARQLCRMLCPSGSGARFPVVPATLVISLDAATGAYDAQGWRAANSVAVLQEASATWHYIDKAGKMAGPLTCRELSAALFDDNHASSSSSSLTKLSKVWSPEMARSGGVCSEWTPLHDLPHLCAALEAFHDTARNTSNNNSISQASKVESHSMSKGAQRQLEAFLYGRTIDDNDDDDDDNGDEDTDGDGDGDGEEQQYESDGGTVYTRHAQTLDWVPLSAAQLGTKKRDEAVQNTTSHENAETGDDDTRNSNQQEQAQKQEHKKKKKKKKKRKRFAARNAKCWIYVTGLPSDTNAEEVAAYFSKVGILDLDPETQQPKVKLYRSSDNNHQLKGDASICYARPESVDLALQLLDDAPFGINSNNQKRIQVQRAKFEQHGDAYEKHASVSNTRRKVAKLAALQAVGWDEGDNGRITGGRKGLRIVVLKRMFDVSEFENEKDKSEDEVLAALERDIRQDVAQWNMSAVLEKVTFFPKNPQGVAVLKFAKPTDASHAVSFYSGRQVRGRRVEASFWDGTTDFTVRSAAAEETEAQETEKRLQDFGDWLDHQEVPEEFQLQVAGE